MSELRLYAVQERSFWTSCDMMSAMRDIEDYVLDRPITLTSAYDKLVEKFRVVLLALQRSHPQLELVEIYKTANRASEQIESPKSPSDSAEEWGDAQTIIPGTYVRMWHTTPLSPWRSSLARESDSPEF